MIWDKLVEIQKNIESELDATGKEIQEDGNTFLVVFVLPAPILVLDKLKT